MVTFEEAAEEEAALEMAPAAAAMVVSTDVGLGRALVGMMADLGVETLEVVRKTVDWGSTMVGMPADLEEGTLTAVYKKAGSA
jgi:hypothetical protein